ncbi:hypothetical protein ACLOJK_037559, partial [Asimina triloba]
MRRLLSSHPPISRPIPVGCIPSASISLTSRPSALPPEPPTPHEPASMPHCPHHRPPDLGSDLRSTVQHLQAVGRPIAPRGRPYLQQSIGGPRQQIPSKVTPPTSHAQTAPFDRRSQQPIEVGQHRLLAKSRFDEPAKPCPDSSRSHAKTRIGGPPEADRPSHGAQIHSQQLVFPKRNQMASVQAPPSLSSTA